MPDPRKYSDGEVREIIDRALRAEEDGSPAVNHGDLVAIGEQIGISPEVMARAAREVAQSKRDEKATLSIKSRRRRWLAAHAATFAVINGLLFAVNYLTTPGEWWALFPIVFWGLALTLHAVAALGLRISERAVTRELAKLDQVKAGTGAKWRVEGESNAIAEGPAPVGESLEAQAASSTHRAQRQ